MENISAKAYHSIKSNSHLPQNVTHITNSSNKKNREKKLKRMHFAEKSSNIHQPHLESRKKLLTETYQKQHYITGFFNKKQT